MSDFYEVLGNTPKEKFRQVINRLLNECFLLKKVDDTASDYRFIISNKTSFEGVLDLLGYELIVQDDLGVITINNLNGTGRIHFTMFESVILLILRLLYIEKMKELSQINEIIVYLEDIYEKYDMLNRGRIRKDQMLNALRKFKSFNLIQNLDRLDTGNMDIRIQIYPSITFAITSTSLDDLYKTAADRVMEFSKGGADDIGDEESDEEAD